MNVKRSPSGFANNKMSKQAQNTKIKKRKNAKMRQQAFEVPSEKKGFCGAFSP